MTLAYLDSSAGLVPCRILAVGDWSNGSSEARVQFTATRGPYRKGEISTHVLRHVVPRSAIYRRKYVMLILPYSWSAIIEKAQTDMQNLDVMSADDLLAFWNRYQHASKASRLTLFGRTGKGTVSACRAVANYASNKATAMQCRERGHIETARQCEGIADRIYNTLPDYARW